MRFLLLIFFVLGALACIFSGVMTLLARVKLPNVPKRRLLISGVFRIGVGIFVLVQLARHY